MNEHVRKPLFPLLHTFHSDKFVLLLSKRAYLLLNLLLALLVYAGALSTFPILNQRLQSRTIARYLQTLTCKTFILQINVTSAI